MKRGLTLIEVLVAVAIIAILVALITAGLVQSRRQAYATDELSALRQLGQAAQMYVESYDRWPRGTPPLVSVRLVPEQLVASKLDPTPRGMANELMLQSVQSKQYEPFLTTYRNTFIGPREFSFADYANFEREILPKPGGGWLVSMGDLWRVWTDESMNPDEKVTAPARYRRLFLDGSVNYRPNPHFRYKTEKVEAVGAKWEWLYFDPTPEEKQKYFEELSASMP